MCACVCVRVCCGSQCSEEEAAVRPLELVDVERHPRGDERPLCTVVAHAHVGITLHCNDDTNDSVVVVVGWRFGVAVTRWSRSTQLLYIEPG